MANLADLTPLRYTGFSDDDIVELTGLIGLHLFLNRMSTFVALPPRQMEAMPDKWWVRIARPLMAIKFRSMRHRAKPTALFEVEKSGPLSAHVNALDGLPMEGELRLIVDRLWASSELPPRTVSMLFAVVARARFDEMRG